MALRILTTLLVITSLSSCLRYRSNLLERVDYHDSRLTIDGYYYANGAYYDKPEPQKNLYTVLIFYRNGWFRSMSFITDRLAELDSLVSIPTGPLRKLEGACYFQVQQDTVTVEYWTNASHFPVPTARGLLKIEIKNQLTGGILGYRPDTPWYFRPLGSKPDSTTRFDDKLASGSKIRRWHKH